MNRKPAKDWPWQVSSLSPEERDRRFMTWTIDRLKDLELDFVPPDIEREAGPEYYVALGKGLDRQIARERKISTSRSAISRMIDRKDKSAFVKLTRDAEVARIVADELFRKPGRQKGELRKGQRQYSDDELDILRYLSADVQSIRRLWRFHGVSRKRDDGLPSAEEIAVEYNQKFPRNFDPDKRRKLIAHRTRDLTNYMKKGRK
jgi:hypothetical protein